jgi:hypothetical protein
MFPAGLTVEPKNVAEQMLQQVIRLNVKDLMATASSQGVLFDGYFVEYISRNPAAEFVRASS